MKKCFSIFLLIGLVQLVSAQVIPVSVITTDSGYQFIRDGKPYYVKGAGGHSHLELLKKMGGNSIRTWSVDNAQEILDEAHQNGISVMLGLWVQHERHGFDYNDKKAVAAQLEKFTKVIKQFKDHPALLIWGIGNEVDLNYSNTKVWAAINDIAKVAHELDPNHPTTTVTAGIDSMEVQLIMKDAPEIDVLSINTYGQIDEVPEQVTRFGWNGPYLITEWGPDGHWEVDRTSWGAPLEQTSQEKADSYYKRYSEYIQPYEKCIGSYVFLWGQKQETTPTWYGLFTEKGEPTQTLDAVERVWKPGDLENPAARNISIHAEGIADDTEFKLETGKDYSFDVSYQLAGYPQEIRWEILAESTDIKSGGDHESRPQTLKDLIKSQSNDTVNIQAPSKPGAYRLFVYVKGNGKVSYANRPFYVN